MYVKFYEFEKKLFNFLCTHAFQCFTFCCYWELERIKSSEQWESKFTIFSLITICKNSNHTGLDKSLYKPYNLQTLDKTEWIWVQTYWLKNGYLNVCMFACLHVFIDCSSIYCWKMPFSCSLKVYLLIYMSFAADLFFINAPKCNQLEVYLYMFVFTIKEISNEQKSWGQQ